MPIIIYKCETCGAYNTSHQAGKDNPKICYYCGGMNLTIITNNEPDDMARKEK